MKAKIVVITPCRNEEQFLPQLIASMLNQSLPPVEWILVDDGSVDNTASIVRKAARMHSWIHLVSNRDRGNRAVGPGVIEAFYKGYNQIQFHDWNYICKLDADLILPPRYFEQLLTYFEKDPYLGAASGKLFLKGRNGTLFEEPNSNEAVWGCANFFQRACFEDVGGYVKAVMWDGIVFHKARMTGWRTRSIRDPELIIVEQRAMGISQGNILKGRRRWGLGQYFMGTHPVFILVIGVYRSFQRPFVLGGLNIVIGYLIAWLRGLDQYEYPGFRKSLHAWQFERMGIGKRLEEIPKLLHKNITEV